MAVYLYIFIYVFVYLFKTNPGVYRYLWVAYKFFWISLITHLTQRLKVLCVKKWAKSVEKWGNGSQKRIASPKTVKNSKNPKIHKYINKNTQIHRHFVLQHKIETYYWCLWVYIGIYG